MSYIVLLLGVGVTIYALVDCWRSTDDEVRGLPRPAWVLVVILFPPLGGTAYLLFGRQPGVPAQGRVIAPDDDPEFLHTLDLDRRRAAAEERRRKEQRDRRERERQERQQRKDQRKGDHNGTGPGAAEGGEGHSDQPTA